MGEHVLFFGKEIKLGTAESLQYATYVKYCEALQSHALSQVPDNPPPDVYAAPNSGFRFRFPFPDEDHLPLGSYDVEYRRGVPVTLSAKAVNPPPDFPVTNGLFQIEVIQQKPVSGGPGQPPSLAPVIRNPANGNSYSINDPATIQQIFDQIVARHVQQETDPGKRSFYQAIADRIAKGYHLELLPPVTENKTTNKPRRPPPHNGGATKKRL